MAAKISTLHTGYFTIYPPNLLHEFAHKVSQTLICIFMMYCEEHIHSRYLKYILERFSQNVSVDTVGPPEDELFWLQWPCDLSSSLNQLLTGAVRTSAACRDLCQITGQQQTRWCYSHSADTMRSESRNVHAAKSKTSLAYVSRRVSFNTEMPAWSIRASNLFTKC